MTALTTVSYNILQIHFRKHLQENTQKKLLYCLVNHMTNRPEDGNIDFVKKKTKKDGFKWLQLLKRITKKSF